MPPARMSGMPTMQVGPSSVRQTPPIIGARSTSERLISISFVASPFLRVSFSPSQIHSFVV
jgi:hypothetical protein